jgi:hypothetical protein
VVRRWPFLLALRFFGLTPKTAPQFRIYVFEHIHNIIFHGKGGYDYDTVYNMPIWLRKFTFNQIQKHFDEEKKAYEESNRKNNSTNMVDSDGKVNTPEFLKSSKQYQRKSQYK